MTTAATIAASLTLEQKEYVQGLLEAKRKAEDLEKRLSEIGDNLQSVGTKMSMSVTAPILAGFALAVKSSSDFNESLSKSNVVFGEHAGAIEAWSAGAAKALGISQGAALEAAATYGNLFQAMGVGQGDAADMSMSLVELASDLASFNNANPEDVLLALRSGLSGEAEAMKKFGVAMNEATLKEAALRLGLQGEFKDLSEADKMQVRYALIMEQTASAQGDFARTADGMANSTRILKAQVVDAAAKLGAQLLPYVLKGVQFISQLVDKFQKLDPTMQQIIIVVGVVAAAIGPLLVIVGSLIGAISAIIPVVTAVGGAIAAVGASTIIPIIAIIAGLIGIIVLLYAAWTQNWGGIQEKVAAVWAFLQPIFEAIGQVIGIVITAYINQLVQNWNTLMAVLQVVWAWIQANIIPLFQAIGELLGAVVGKALQALAGLWQKVLLPALIAVYTQIYTQLQPVLNVLAEFWTNTLGPAIETVKKNVLDKLTGVFDGISKAIQGVVKWIKDLADKIMNLELPSWLTPGSPTPLEMGLRGITKAMSSLVSSELPQFQSGLNLSMAGAGGGGSTTNQTNYFGAYYGGGPNQPGGRPLDNLRRPM